MTQEGAFTFNFSGLRFYRITGLVPGFKAAQDRIGPCKTGLQEKERHPGARIFSRSGTVGDVPGVGVQFADPVFELVQRDIDRTGDVSLSELRLAAGIHDHRGAILLRFIGFLSRDPDDLVLIGHLSGVFKIGLAGVVGNDQPNDASHDDHRHQNNW